MLTYEYVARDPRTGEKIKAQVQAENEQAAAKLVKQAGYAAIDIKVKTETGKGPLSKFRNRIKTKDKVIFSRQLATLINSGLPLVQSLRNVAEQTQSKPFKIVINQIISEIEGGSAFAAALAKHPTVFNDLFVNLVAAGETSGTLDAALERLANQQEKDAEILSKVRGAMVYPVIVLLVMVAVVGFMVIKVLPQVEEIYKDLPGVNLPIVTRMLLAVSHFVTKYWWLLLTLFVAGGLFTTRWVRTLGGKRAVDRFKLRAPLFGPLFTKLYMARFSRTATTLVASGVPLIQMLQVTSRAVSNIHIEESLQRAIEKVKGGTALSEALSKDPNFLSLVPDMMRIGEQSGSLEKMLEKTADYYEKEVDNQIKVISTIIEPALMVILGVVAFVIVAAILLPIYSLVGKNIIR